MSKRCRCVGKKMALLVLRRVGVDKGKSKCAICGEVKLGVCLAECLLLAELFLRSGLVTYNVLQIAEGGAFLHNLNSEHCSSILLKICQTEKSRPAFGNVLLAAVTFPSSLYKLKSSLTKLAIE